MSIEWVKLSTYNGPSEAEMVCQLLIAHGIQAQLRSQVPQQLFPLSVTRLAEVAVWVDATERKQAAELIADRLRIGFRVLPDEEDGT